MSYSALVTSATPAFTVKPQQTSQCEEYEILTLNYDLIPLKQMLNSGALPSPPLSQAEHAEELSVFNHSQHNEMYSHPHQHQEIYHPQPPQYSPLYTPTPCAHTVSYDSETDILSGSSYMSPATPSYTFQPQFNSYESVDNYMYKQSSQFSDSTHSESYFMHQQAMETHALLHSRSNATLSDGGFDQQTSQDEVYYSCDDHNHQNQDGGISPAVGLGIEVPHEDDHYIPFPFCDPKSLELQNGSINAGSESDFTGLNYSSEGSSSPYNSGTVSPNSTADLCLLQETKAEPEQDLDTAPKSKKRKNIAASGSNVSRKRRRRANEATVAVKLDSTSEEMDHEEFMALSSTVGPATLFPEFVDSSSSSSVPPSGHNTSQSHASPDTEHSSPTASFFGHHHHTNKVITEMEFHNSSTSDLASAINGSLTTTSTRSGATNLSKTSAADSSDISSPSSSHSHSPACSSFGSPSYEESKRVAVYRRGRKPSPVDDSEKAFVCEDCNRRFRRQEHLKRHYRSLHTREKPFECDECGKKFSRSDNLAQHTRTHARGSSSKDRSEDDDSSSEQADASPVLETDQAPRRKRR